MTKLEISRELADRTGLSLTDATRSTDAFFDIFKDAFANGHDVFVRGFGTFKVIERKQKVARDINKGTQVIIPARNVVKFIPSYQLTVKQ